MPNGYPNGGGTPPPSPPGVEFQYQRGSLATTANGAAEIKDKAIRYDATNSEEILNIS